MSTFHPFLQLGRVRHLAPIAFTKNFSAITVRRMLIPLAALVLAPSSVTAVRDAYPMLSPDGQTIVFQSNRSGRQALWLADADGGRPRPLFDHDGNPATPAWSPDGQLIVFARHPEDSADPEESEIYLIRKDGSGLLRLTKTPGDDSHPHWSSDGTRVFFNSPRETPDLRVEWSKQNFGIYSMKPDGTDVRLHIRCYAVCTFPVPSPDGRKIAFRKVLHQLGKEWDQHKSAGNSEIFVANLDGGDQRNLSRDAAFDGWPAWSPDSKYVLFSSNRDGQISSGQIYRVSLDGGTVQRLTEPDGWSRAQPTVSRDGSILLYELKEDERTEIGHIARLKAS